MKEHFHQAIQSFGQALQNWISHFGQVLPRLILAAVILFLGWKLAHTLRRSLTSSVFGESPRAQSIAGAAYWSVLLLSVVVAGGQAGLDVSLIGDFLIAGILVSAGGLSLALALGSRQTVSNILGTYHLRKLYRPGQILRIGEVQGRSKSVTATELILENDEGEIRIPGAMAESQIIQRTKDLP